MENIFREIKFERIKQDNKWGEQNHPCLKQHFLQEIPQKMCLAYNIPTEGQAKKQCDKMFKMGMGTYADIAIEEMSEIVSEYDPYKRRQEIVQLAAVCVAWIEKIDRDLKNPENEE